jgi:hypothetical protein
MVASFHNQIGIHSSYIFLEVLIPPSLIFIAIIINLTPKKLRPFGTKPVFRPNLTALRPSITIFDSIFPLNNEWPRSSRLGLWDRQCGRKQRFRIQRRVRKTQRGFTLQVREDYTSKCD